MSVGAELIAAAVKTGDPKNLLSNLVNPDFFNPYEKNIYEFIKEHCLKHGVFPHKETLVENSITLPPVNEPVSYYSDRVYDRYVKTEMIDTIKSAQDLLHEKPSDAVKMMVQKMNKVIMSKPDFGMVDLFNTDDELMEQYWNKRNGIEDSGMLFGWPSLDEMSSGILPGDFITVSGRPSSGKTFLNLYIALKVWMEHKVPVLFVSMEMVTLPIAQRLMAMMTKIPLDHIRKGLMANSEIDRLKKAYTVGSNRGIPFDIVDGRGRYNTRDLLNTVMMTRPGLVVVDGAYLMKLPKKEAYGVPKHERIGAVAEFLKQDIATSQDTRVIASYQLNRESVKANFIDQSHIAGSDEIPQLSTIALAIQGDEKGVISVEKKRKVQILKGRNGEEGEFEINWQFKPRMDFAEVVEPEPMGYV